MKIGASSRRTYFKDLRPGDIFAIVGDVQGGLKSGDISVLVSIKDVEPQEHSPTELQDIELKVLLDKRIKTFSVSSQDKLENVDNLSVKWIVLRCAEEL